MHYDPVKKTLGKIFNATPLARILFYKLLDMLLLRTWHVHRELRKWRKSAPVKAHILDAGSGFGQYAYFLSGMNQAYCVLGIDVKQDQVCECNTFFRRIGRENAVFRVDDLTTFRKQSCFDLVLCVDVMEHIEEDVKVMTNYCYNLKPGGLLIISTPSDKGGSDVHGAGDTSFIEEHVRDGYNMNEIKEKLKSAGFTRVKAHYSYGTPGQISWRFSMKYPMKMLNLSQLFLIILPVYYVVVMPLALILNFIDSHAAHRSGTGLVVLAWK